MSPLMMRFFTLVGVALAAATMQMKAHADTLPGAGAPQAQQLVQTASPAHAVGTLQSPTL